MGWFSRNSNNGRDIAAILTATVHSGQLGDKERYTPLMDGNVLIAHYKLLRVNSVPDSGRVLSRKYAVLLNGKIEEIIVHEPKNQK